MPDLLKDLRALERRAARAGVDDLDAFSYALRTTRDRLTPILSEKIRAECGQTSAEDLSAEDGLRIKKILHPLRQASGLASAAHPLGRERGNTCMQHGTGGDKPPGAGRTI